MELNLVRRYKDRRLEMRVFHQLREQKGQVLAGKVLREGLLSEAGAQFMHMAQEDMERWSREERNTLFSLIGILLAAALLLAPISIPIFCIVGLVTAIMALYRLQK